MTGKGQGQTATAGTWDTETWGPRIVLHREIEDPGPFTLELIALTEDGWAVYRLAPHKCPELTAADIDEALAEESAQELSA